jgi:hypothetical protein
MPLLPLLGKALKDESIIEILEAMEMEVIYDFDRLQEGEPDQYWASSHEAGIQLRFNAAQALATVFLYILPDDDFAAFSQLDCDIPLFATAAEAQAFGEVQRLQVSEGSADFLGVTRDWLRLRFDAYSIHYEFRTSGLALVTVSLKEC